MIDVDWKQERQLVPYPDALTAMEARVEAILAREKGELIWCLEHPPLYTAGTGASPDDLVDSAAMPVYTTGRGGKHTYHGPGQRVIYVMMDLASRDRDLRAHVWRLEEWIIRVLAALRIESGRRKGRVGVWVEKDGHEKKIAALGVRARRWVTSHGLALNVKPDLSHFAGIVPCGIKEYGVTSLHDMGVNISMEEVDALFRNAFDEIFAQGVTP